MSGGEVGDARLTTSPRRLSPSAERR